MSNDAQKDQDVKLAEEYTNEFFERAKSVVRQAGFDPDQNPEMLIEAVISVREVYLLRVSG